MANPAPTGTVNLLDSDGTTVLAVINLVTRYNNDAACDGSATLSDISVGVHNITASYAGDSFWGPSVSNAVPLTITADKPTPVFTLTCNTQSAGAGAAVQFSITNA